MIYEKIPQNFNLTSYLIDECNLKQGRKGKNALYYHDETYTYGQLDKKINQYANYLKSLNLSKGQQVGIYLNNSPEFVFLFLSTIKTGIVPVVINPLTEEHILLKILEGSPIEYLFTTQDLADSIHLTEIKNIVSIRTDMARATKAEKNTFTPEKTCKDDIAFVLFTSGSTGVPKGVVHRHYSIVIGEKTFIDTSLQSKSSDVFYSPSLMSFTMGLDTSIFFPFLKGSSSVIHDDYSPYSILDILHKYRITIFFAVPSIYAILHTLIPDFQNPFCQCRYCIASGESLSKQVIRAWRQKFGIRLCQVYCTTELLFPVLSNISATPLDGSAGKVIYGYKALLFNNEYAPTKVNEIGKLVIQGEGIATEYWGNEQLPSKVLRKNSYFSSDQFYRDKDGYFWFSGRDSEVFKMNGNWES